MAVTHKFGTARDRYFVEQAETLVAAGSELVDTGTRLIGLARHLHAVALGTATHGDVSVADARRLGEEMLTQRTARRRRADAA